MAMRWLDLCRGPGLAIQGDTVEVSFRDGRKHRVRAEERDDTLFLSAVVVGAARAKEAEANEVLLWKHNHGTRLTSFRLDARGRVVGEAFMPLVGLTHEAVCFRVRIVAEECDHLERILTGKDLE